METSIIWSDHYLLLEDNKVSTDNFSEIFDIEVYIVFDDLGLFPEFSHTFHEEGDSIDCFFVGCD